MSTACKLDVEFSAQCYCIRFRGVPAARASAQRELARKSKTRAVVIDEEEEQDPEEREWPTSVARLGENTSLCFWQFTE